ncbi:hypothetical protein SOCEGT47_026370 [Sorangium cellulosum]|uniref:Sigma-54 factor interaction domain-containing protein n=1 Tax=Sorangium cellulosum TaxID=56 RepID=A0A4P2PZU3_SORCE|nr:hypothetical protein [Sorangium cellulosum]AUX22136.1 hypothetical protein SOCEGT47_026370 [Sorangium cellulosum]
MRSRRSFWIAAAAVAYTAFAALRASGGHGTAWLALLGLPPLLALGLRSIERPPRGEDRIDPAARSAAAVCLTGAATLAASRSGPGGLALIALGNLGAAAAAMAALVALARVAGLGGLLEAPPSTRRLDAAAFASLFWTVAVALPAVSAVAPERAAELDPVLIDYATSAASLGSLTVTLVALAHVRIARRLELGVADRVEAALLFTATALAVGLSSAFVGVARPEAILPVTSAVAAVCVAACVVAADAAQVSRALRLTLAIAALATPPALLAVYAVHEAPRGDLGLRGAPQSSIGVAVFGACALCALAGLAAPALARRFAPEGARWLGAFDAATRAAMNPEPEAALETALSALREASDAGYSGQAPPALYLLAPAERVTVDRAGYTHTERAEVPARLIELCQLEPERVLRIEAAEAVQVRRPEVRPLIEWLTERDVGVVALVNDAEGPIGALAVPRGRRASPMTLEEVNGLRALADRLGAVIAVSAMLSGSRGREVAARREGERLTREVERLSRALERDAGRSRAIAALLARPARAAAYSPAARAAVEQLERLAAGGGPVTLLTAPGIDAVAWGAVVHLSSARAGGPLAIVDGAAPALEPPAPPRGASPERGAPAPRWGASPERGGASPERDAPASLPPDARALALWRDPDSSPIEAAKGGTLLVLDAQALPTEVQRYLGAALPDDVGLVVAVPRTVDTLVATGQMDERLADRLGDRAVALPSLASRGEDLRALALDHLARIGVRLRGRPFGLDLRALQTVLDHPWPGNDAEMGAVLLRAALVAEGDVIGEKELAAIGFTAEPEPPGRARAARPAGAMRRRRASKAG